MQKRLTIIALVVAAVLGMAIVMQMLRDRLTNANIAQLETQLHDEDADVRHTAATTILRAQPDHPSARLVSAAALLELGQRSEARKILASTLQHADAPGFLDAVILLTQSYMDEAAEQLHTTDVELAIERATPLINEALSTRLLAGDIAKSDARLLMFQARALDLRSTLLDRKFRIRSLELNRARAISFEQQIESLGLTVDQTQKAIVAQDKELAEVCAYAIKTMPRDSQPYLYEFRRLRRSQYIADARDAAARMLDLPSIDRAVAGEIAYTLLSSELLVARPVTAADIELARRLITAPALTEDESLWHDLAEAELALQENRPTDALKLARSILDEPDYAAHPRATAMLARAMIALNRGTEAASMMARFNDVAATSEGLMVQGLADMAAGDDGHAREAFRQSLELEPQNLPARIAMIDSLFRRNAILDAEQDILLSQKISPTHPRVRGFVTRLLIEKLDRQAIWLFIEPALTNDVLKAEDTLIIGRMAIDDRATIAPLVTRRLAANPDDTLGLLTQSWLVSGARRRWEIAFLLSRRYLESLTINPLGLAGAPQCPVPLAPDVYAIVTPDDQPAPLPSETDAYHFARSLPQIALVITRLACERWPESRQELLPTMIELAVWSGDNALARPLIDELAPAPAEGSLLAVLRQSLDGQSLTGLDSLPPSPTRFFLSLEQALLADDFPLIQQRVRELLTAHPWAEPAFLHAVRHALEKSDPTAAKITIEIADRINPEMARLARGRMNLALRNPREALEAASAVGRDEATDSEVRVQATEITARANLLIGQPELAAGAFETLAFSMEDRSKLPMRLSALDVLVRTQRDRKAAVVIGTLAADAETRPDITDQVLVRAAIVMTPQRLDALIETLRLRRPDEPVLWLHQSHALLAAGNTEEASRLCDRLKTVAPSAPRVLQLAEQIAQAAARSAPPSPATRGAGM